MKNSFIVKFTMCLSNRFMTDELVSNRSSEDETLAVGRLSDFDKEAILDNGEFQSSCGRSLNDVNPNT